MSVPADRNWTCIKCKNTSPIGKCRNCEFESYVKADFDAGLVCGRCGERLRIPDCAQCGTRTPIERAMIERAGDHHPWALGCMGIALALFLGGAVLQTLGELWERFVK